MSRRFHKKSRNGCLECKRRHIRCDETRPFCVNCSTAKIQCSFRTDGSHHFIPAFSPGHQPATIASNISSAGSTPPQTVLPEKEPTNRKAPDSFNLNMTHLELFNNLYSENFLAVQDPEQSSNIPVSIYIKYSLSTPYLMHQILASSALQLSITRPESRDFYREYATGLQYRAIAILNETNPLLVVTPENRIQMFLFSSAVGVHLLSDTLHYQRETLEQFIDNFTHCLSVCSGVLAVVGECWDLLRETELGPHLISSSIPLPPGVAKGSECQGLCELIETADLSPTLRTAYHETVLKLQRVFDAQQTLPGVKIRVPLVITWLIIVSSDYVEALRQLQPEALIILAHYAVLLHRGRDLWLVGDGGRFLIESICGRLGSKWDQWLKVPRDTLLEKVEYLEL